MEPSSLLVVTTAARWRARWGRRNTTSGEAGFVHFDLRPGCNTGSDGTDDGKRLRPPFRRGPTI